MTMNSDTVSVLEGNTFVVGGRNGDVDAGPGQPHGLFHRNTRHLSRAVRGGEPITTAITATYSIGSAVARDVVRGSERVVLPGNDAG